MRTSPTSVVAPSNAATADASPRDAPDGPAPGRPDPVPSMGGHIPTRPIVTGDLSTATSTVLASPRTPARGGAGPPVDILIQRDRLVA